MGGECSGGLTLWTNTTTVEVGGVLWEGREGIVRGTISLKVMCRITKSLM